MVRLYVEGGGRGKDLPSMCRRGFRGFLKKAGLQGSMPRIVASGSRNSAYRDYCTAIKNGETALLLVDSEGPVDPAHQSGHPEAWQPWQHLKQRDNWDKPQGGHDLDCHLMVQCMESWFLADREALSDFFGQCFRESALPAAQSNVESFEPKDALTRLKSATKDCQTKGKYDKSAHSFELLARLDPDKVTAASPWAKRWIDTLKKTHDR